MSHSGLLSSCLLLRDQSHEYKYVAQVVGSRAEEPCWGGVWCVAGVLRRLQQGGEASSEFWGISKSLPDQRGLWEAV